MSKIFALVDCNNFYVSCERLFAPNLANKPVVVVSSVGGCALARSNEAKKLGILMGQPYFEWKIIAEKNNVKLFTPNFPLYGDISNRIMKTLSQFSDEYEVYSIDECFLDLTGMEVGNLAKFGRKIKETVKKVVGIPVSVGIAPTKTLAKVANEIGKGSLKEILSSRQTQLQDDDGVVNLMNIGNLDEILKNISVEDVWGIGRQTATKLHIANIHTAYDFTRLNGEFVHKTYGIGFYHTWLELKGTACENISHTTIDKKSIMCTRTFAKPTQDVEKLTSYITDFASHATEKLRVEKYLAKYVTVFVRTSRFVDRERRYSRDLTLTLPDASDYTPDIVRTALHGLKQIFDKGYIYKRAGVILSVFSEKSAKQMSIDSRSDVDEKKRAKLMKAVDSLNASRGAGTIRLGSPDTCSRPDEFKQTALRSPHYTTKWNEIKNIQ